MKESSSQEREIRAQKRKALQDAGINPYPHKFTPTHSSKDVQEHYHELEGQNISLAGRLLVKRRFGKILFAHLRDSQGQVQIYLDQQTKSPVPEKNPVKFFDKNFDPGDIVGVEGTVFTTKTGEKTLRVSSYTMLAKALRPMPDKWHGVSDPELAYRDRPLFLIANPGEKERFLTRSRIIKLIRLFMDQQGFVEFETPTLQPLYGGGAARPFITHSHALETDLYLRIADELYLKRLLVSGFDRVFEICKDFRNEGIDRTHYPEFTMMEAYAAWWDYQDMMQLVEHMLSWLAQEIAGSAKITYQGKEIDFSGPFQRVDYTGALSQALGFDVMGASLEQLREAGKKLGIENPENLHTAKLLDKIFDIVIAPELVNPSFVLDHPMVMSPLAKPHRSRQGLVERFELFVNGIEIANAFSELNDPVIQRENMERDAALRDEELPSQVDEDFLTALERGMPPAGGIGIGIDRVVMFLTDAPSIRDVIAFPQLRPK